MSDAGSLAFKASVIIVVAAGSFAGGMRLEYKLSLSKYLGLEEKVTKAEADALKAAAAEQVRQAEIARDAAMDHAARDQSAAADADKRLAEYRSNAKARLSCAPSPEYRGLFNGAVGGAAANPGKRP
jgi:hypothetical protein